MKNSQSKLQLHFAVVAVDVACFRVMNNTLMTLVAKTPQYSPFPGEWALVGGMVRPTETTDDAVQRLLEEKADIEYLYAEQVHTFSAIDRDPRGRVVAVGYLAISNTDPKGQSNVNLEPTWITAEKIPKLAYDHNQIFKHALEKLRQDIIHTDIARHFAPKEFTLSELQTIYDAVLGEKTDKRNFRKRILSLNVLKDLKRVKKQGVMRPAALYAFK